MHMSKKIYTLHLVNIKNVLTENNRQTLSELVLFVLLPELIPFYNHNRECDDVFFPPNLFNQFFCVIIMISRTRHEIFIQFFFSIWAIRMDELTFSNKIEDKVEYTCAAHVMIARTWTHIHQHDPLIHTIVILRSK